jgi:hypothetical protein
MFRYSCHPAFVPDFQPGQNAKYCYLTEPFGSLSPEIYPLDSTKTLEVLPRIQRSRDQEIADPQVGVVKYYAEERVRRPLRSRSSRSLSDGYRNSRERRRSSGRSIRREPHREGKRTVVGKSAVVDWSSRQTGSLHSCRRSRERHFRTLLPDPRLEHVLRRIT